MKLKGHPGHRDDIHLSKHWVDVKNNANVTPADHRPLRRRPSYLLALVFESDKDYGIRHTVGWRLKIIRSPSD